MKTFYEEVMKQYVSREENHLKKMIQVMDQAEIFHIQNVADYFFEVSEKDIWQVEDFPNLAPPFPVFWMEFVTPKKLNSEGKILDNPNGGNWTGYLFSAEEISPSLAQSFSPETKWAMTATLFMQAKDQLVGAGIHWLVTLDQMGRVTKNKQGEPIFYLNVDEELAKADDFYFVRHRSQLSVFVWPAFLAISLLHCKNVEILSKDPRPKEPGKRRRRNESKLRYHILQIEPMKKILREEGSAEETGIKHALHICRGHFKDFTKGKGLFGKYKDVFWWDSQVRGRADQGVVLKDYNVNEPSREIEDKDA